MLEGREIILVPAYLTDLNEPPFGGFFILGDWMRMPFGKYRGWELEALPDEYLEWLMSIDLRNHLASGVEREYERRFVNSQRDNEAIRKVIPEPEVLDLAFRIISIGYKRLATQMHPDAGGEHGEMVLLNAANDYLHKYLRGLEA